MVVYYNPNVSVSFYLGARVIMASYNRVILLGNLTRDPEYKQLSSGQAVCRLGLASNRQFKNRATGEMVQEVCFIDVDVWGAQAERCNQYLQKGRAVLVEGRLKLDMWEQEGQKRSKHSVVADRVTFLSSGSDESSESSYSSAESSLSGHSNRPSQASQSGEVSLGEDKPFDDELPF